MASTTSMTGGRASGDRNGTGTSTDTGVSTNTDSSQDTAQGTEPDEGSPDVVVDLSAAGTSEDDGSPDDTGDAAPTPAEEAEALVVAMWREYKDTGDRAVRDRLIVHYSPLVKYVAGRVGVGLPPNVEHADLVSYGVFGLIDAIDKYDLERAIKFETYAISRIRGAIIDELRSIDWIPRSVRSKSREVERTYAALEAELHRSPTEQEVADRLGISIGDLHQIFSKVSYANVVALDELMHAGSERGDSLTLGDTLKDNRAEDPVQAFETQETKFLLSRAINLLPEREKIVVTLYYYEGLTLAEIGRVLGVTESRICQMHTKAVMQLRAKLSAAGDG
ncbi:RNA polymerase sigma factor WhiG [Jannaschia sp. R86511]|uniref:RNA polymerase sigma factor WhiG n=1 Tax=Jannaschia sp. R86511 TaxID=3093853 RepID=UPI0036D36F7A